MRLPRFDNINAAGRDVSIRLDAIRERIGASEGNIGNMDNYITGGDLKDLAERYPDEPIIISGRCSRVYIRDHDSHYHDLGDAIESARRNGCYTDGKKVHFYYCRTLRTMEDRGRYDRYQIQPPNLWDEYYVDFHSRKNFPIRLPLCKNCVSVMANKSRYRTDREQREKIAWRGSARQCMDCVEALHKGESDARDRVRDFFRQSIAGKPPPK